MDFKTFIQNTPDNQNDPFANQVIRMINEDQKFPVTSDIKLMAKYIFKKLTRQQTTAFQKLLMFWKSITSPTMQPNDSVFLQELNHIIDLQNKSGEYAAKILRGEV